MLIPRLVRDDSFERRKLVMQLNSIFSVRASLPPEVALKSARKQALFSA